MKKMLVGFFILMIAVYMVGCNGFGDSNQTTSDKSNNQTPTKTSDNKSKTDNKNQVEDEKEKNKNLSEVEAYFPMKKNTRYIYEGSGNEFASFDIYNDYIEGKKIQQRVNNGGTVMAYVIEIKNGQLLKTYSRGEVYYRENLLKETGDTEVLLKEPLSKGTQWTLADSRIRTITATDASVTTPTGTYKAIEVTTEDKEGKSLDYYAANMGLVKSVFVTNGSEVSSTLGKIEENVPLVQQIRFYYPNIDDDKLYYKDREVRFFTNDITRKILAEEYKKAENNEAVFSKNTMINSLYLNKDQQVYIDLNKEFINEMSAGAAFEGKILQSIVNTFGGYYHAERVYLTINNTPYESGHISKQKGEYFIVNTENAVKLP